MAAPFCTCGRTLDNHDTDDGETWCYGLDEAGAYTCECRRDAPPGSLEDILGVWRDQGPFPLRNTADVKLLVDEIVRLRALVNRP